MSTGDRVKTGLAIGASVLGCGNGRGPSSQPEPSSATVPAQTERAPERDRDKAAVDRLRKAAVYTNDVARGVLYSWTTTEQIAELQRDKILLTRTQSPTKGLARFDRTLRTLRDPVSRLLQREGWNRRRFAWSNPWATIAGWPQENYGNQLIEIRLRPDAWLGVLVSVPCVGRQTPTWTFVDLWGKPVAQSAVLAEPKRLAAVFHQTGADLSGAALYCGNSFVRPSVPFREYVIVHEEMVERWAIGTDAIGKAILLSRATLRTVQSAVENAPGRFASVDWRTWARGLNKQTWPKRVVPETVLALYEANLTWGNQLYLPTVHGLEKIIKRLQVASGEQPKPLSHRPDPKQLRDYWKRHTTPTKAKPSGGGGTF